MSNESLSISLTRIQILIPSIQDIINGLINPISDRNVKLIPREVECLKWASEGKSGWEMSKILNCIERTISFHMSNIGTKLNSNNRTKSIAILLGYLLPSLEY
ncbi:hypothetical protein GNP44_03335 [Aliivibrio fischeri]|uniref:helix-turn-helix domain-containing protein n=1 Tax=Aliivibrio fischeri TaxID=668 RepID=UPI0012D8F82D|nr:helix-turn-helix transcriptional regulator [Aliivibrio fischeri]MUK29133.1 hypothetical protein [Aliivibrio fischeri]